MAAMPTKGTAEGSGSHRGIQDDLSQASGPAQHHDKSVNPDPDTPGRGHPLFERLDEGLVEGLGLLVAAFELGRLLFEAPPLLVRIVQLAERVGDLDAAGEGLPALAHA